MARALPSDFARYTSGLTHWRRVIFKRLFGFLAILCVPVYFTSVYLCIAADLWGMAIFDTFAYFLLVLLLFYPHFSDRLRFSLGCLLAYAIGVGFLIAIGPSGAGFFWLFIFPPLSNIFLGTKASIYAQVLNGVSLIFIGVSYHYEWLIWPVIQGYSTGIWAVVSINFLVTNAMVTLTIAYLLGKLTSSLDSTLASRQATVLGLAKLAEYRDNETGAHLLRMRQYSKMLATQRMLADNSPPELDEDFIQASLLEYAPQCTFIKMGRDIASGHHEKWDGSGYPLGLKEENIPLSARIVALVDVYDALTSPRCYKRPFTHEDAKAMILEGRAKHFDPVLVDCFMQIHTEFEVLSKASLLDDPQSTVAQPKMV